jgi:CRP/FNR family cyclic AMP-dependent transcriptional regulator
MVVGMASMKKHLENLDGVSLFVGCSKKDLARIAKAGDELERRAGSVLMEQDRPGREAFVILEGEVVVRRNNRKVATLGPGGVVGELSLLDSGPRTATATCETDCLLFVIDHRRFGAVLDAVPAMAKKVMQNLAGKIRELDNKAYG